MAYDHKKSIRTVTDVQMSESTSIDGSRIDRALDESTDRFNNLRGGDFSESFTKSSFVFGMQPSPIVPSPMAAAGGTGTPGYNTIASIETDARDYPITGQWLPWLPIKNSPFTTHQSTTGSTYADKYNAGGSTPTGGFQNEWRFKGTNVDNRPDMVAGTYPPPVLSEAMSARWDRGNWANFWAGTAGWATYDQSSDEPQPYTPYQFAWSHSWEFPSPAILDDMMLFIRTDREWDASRDKYAATSHSGWYDTPYEYESSQRIGGTYYVFSSRDVMFQISVDNSFSPEERNLNDIEATFNSRPLDGWRVSQTSMLGMQYSDMLPNSPEYDTGAGTGDALSGRMIRFSDMNIPIRKLARVRLSVIIPWYTPATTTAGNAHQDQIKNTRGLSPSRWGANTFPGAAANSKTAEPVPYGGTCLMGAPWDNCSINGCLTILEDVES